MFIRKCRSSRVHEIDALKQNLAALSLFSVSKKVAKIAKFLFPNFSNSNSVYENAKTLISKSNFLTRILFYEF